MTTYYLTFVDSDYPCDHEEYVNIDDAYDMAEAISSAAKSAVNIYENDTIIAVVKNF